MKISIYPITNNESESEKLSDRNNLSAFNLNKLKGMSYSNLK